MLHLQQTVCILIISCIYFTLAQSVPSSNILPGKYHAYSQHHTKKLHATKAKGLDLQHHHHPNQQRKLAIARQENPINYWINTFNRNKSRPQQNSTTSTIANNVAVANNTLPSTKCSCR